MYRPKSAKKSSTKSEESVLAKVNSDRKKVAAGGGYDRIALVCDLIGQLME
jgi:hypothetical protein